MPTKYTPEMTGEQILAAVKANVAEARRTLADAKAREDWPVEYRRAQRNAALAVIERHVREGQAAFSAWANRARADADAALRAEKVGSPAEETRRLRLEMELDRLIDAGRRDEPRVVNGRLVRNPSAFDYAGQALEAYIDGDYERAVMLARAAQALDGPPRAAKVQADAQAQIDLADPAKAQALKDVRTVERGLMTFGRDVNAALADAYTAASEAAQAVGDDHRRYAQQAVGPSMTAKALALGLAERDDDGRVVGYAAPEGTLASAPGGALRTTDGMLDRVTSTTR